MSNHPTSAATPPVRRTLAPAAGWYLTGRVLLGLVGLLGGWAASPVRDYRGCTMFCLSPREMLVLLGLLLTVGSVGGRVAGAGLLVHGARRGASPRSLAAGALTLSVFTTVVCSILIVGLLPVLF